MLNGIRVVKLYAYETFFGGRIGELRSQEMGKLKTIAITRAGMTATMVRSVSLCRPAALAF